jgi:HicA toxin of bacterial toxin-antitoxin,
MNKKQRRVLEAIFVEPVRSVRWADIESLFNALGGDVTEGAGSRVRVALNGVRAVFHRPHPAKETRRGALRAVRDFLTEAGVQL